jgi:hypothetical protein
MAGAQIIFTLYQNGIHVPYSSSQPFVTNPTIERLLGDALATRDKQTIARVVNSDELGPLCELIEVAVDSYSAEDKRPEVFPETPTPLDLPG